MNYKKKKNHIIKLYIYIYIYILFSIEFAKELFGFLYEGLLVRYII